MSRSASEVVNAYDLVLWCHMRPELITEICADPLVRRCIGKRVELSHEEQMERVEAFRGRGLFFERVLQFSEGGFVTWVWNCSNAQDSEIFSGIEIFRVVDGRITEVWNSPYGDELWG